MSNGKIERIKQLIKILNHASNEYYNSDNPLISDYDWDRQFDELKQLEAETGCVFSNSPTQNVGYEVKSKLEKVKHSHPMLSLGKTKSENDLKAFSDGKDCVLSLKMDGLTMLNTYENGEFIQSESRGNGEVGELLTHNAKVFKNLPLHIKNTHKIEFEGEAIITKDDFELINSKLSEDNKYKNCRNLASGSVRQLDSRIAKDRHLKFVCWKIPYGFTTYREGFAFAKDMGFEVVPFVIYNSNTDDIHEKIEELKAIAEEKNYPIDGIVIAYDNIEYGKSLGMTGHHPRNALAFKFYDEEEVTILRNIEWGMGKTGQLTPVALFDDVEIDGTNINRASVHNITILKELQLGIGDEITVYKANQIIPQLRENLTKSNNCIIPNKCPICGEPTKIVKQNDSEVLICANDNCPGKLLGKLSHAVSKNALNIDGLSEATIQKFIDFGWLTKIKDVYNLEAHKKEMSQLEGFGSKSVSKLLTAIENSRNTDLTRFLYAQSIPLIGHTASKDIAKYCNNSLDQFRMVVDMDVKPFIKLSGFGEEMSKSIKKWWNTHHEEFCDLAQEFNFKEEVLVNNSDVLKNKVFVITGSVHHFANRDALKNKIESLGGKVSGSVSAKTSYLINNDNTSKSSKNVKAMQLNIPIITEDDFLNMIGE